MTWNKWDRQLHRWLSIIFTATIIVGFVAAAFGMRLIHERDLRSAA